MRFRQFEFRLFPKIKSRKKKKAGKLCNYDYPRDIGLDRNSNYSSSSCYDNMAAETNYTENLTYGIYHNGSNYVNCGCFDTQNKLMSCSYDSQIPELNVNTDCVCNCSDCSIACYQNDKDVLTGSHSAETQLGTTLLGSSNTLPRIRTRIKTNPWLPSPRSTPTSTPTDPIASFREQDESIHSMTSSQTAPMPTGSEWSYPPCVASSYPGLIQIAPVGTTCIPMNRYIVKQQLNSGVSGSKNKYNLHLEIVNKAYNTNNKANSQQRNTSDKVNSRCNENDVSHKVPCVGEMINNTNIKEFECDFNYENSADDLLETLTLPRDDTFDSLTEDVSVVNDTNNGETSINIQEQGIVRQVQDDSIITSEADPNPIRDMGNETRIMNFGVLNGSPESKMCQTDSRKDREEESPHSREVSNISMKILDYFGNKDDCTHDSNLVESPTNNMQDSIDTGYASATRDFDSEGLSSDDDMNSTNVHTSDLELEWDNEPTTEILTIDPNMTTSYSTPVKHWVRTDRQVSKSMTQSVYTESFRKRRKSSIDVTEEEDSEDHKRLIGKIHKRRSRSLADIQLSLDEKVTMLREEKTFVQRKIQESINADRIRLRQSNALDALSKPERKEVLLKTLYDLKTRLEEQSTRLQSSYSTVLTLRKRFSQRRSTLTLETDL